MIRLDWGGSRAQEEMLRRVGQRLADLSPATKAGAEVIKTLIDDSFDKSRDPWGKPWKGFAQSTLKQRRQGKNTSKPKGKLLVDTGVLRNSMSAVGEPRAIVFGSVFEGRRNKSGALVAGYAQAHQYGGGDLPARPFLPVTQGGVDFRAGTPAGKAMQKIQSLIADFIMSGQRKAA